MKTITNDTKSARQVMSEEELDALNRWIAMYIMGWIPCHGDFWNPNGTFNCDPAIADRWAFEYPGGLKFNNKQYCTCRVYEFSPVSEVHDAVEVLQKCMERCGTEGIKLYKCHNGDFLVETQTAEDAFFHERAPSLPLAISKFSKGIYTLERK